MSEFWEKQKGESRVAYNAFTHYRDSGPRRSLRNTRQALDRPWTTISDWSSRHLWVARAEAYDAHLEEEERKELEEYRKDMNRRHRNVARLAMSRAVEFLNSTQGQEMSYQQLSSILNSAANLERLASGEVTSRSESVQGGEYILGLANSQPLDEEYRRTADYIARRVLVGKDAPERPGVPGDEPPLPES